MNRTAIVCVTWKGPSEPTRAAIAALELRGAESLIYAGVTDVSLARSMALTHVLGLLEGNTRIETLLMLDDDVEPEPDDAQRLVDVSRTWGAVSGVYGTSERKIAASKHPTQEGRYLTGLGFFAVPVKQLRRLQAWKSKMHHAGRDLTPFCCTGRHPDSVPGMWTSEDYWLCLDLGGVVLAPIPAAHHKTMPIVPGAAALEAIGRSNLGARDALIRGLSIAVGDAQFQQLTGLASVDAAQ